MGLEKAFGKKFAENKDLLRVRSFELNGQPFRVKVPLTAELEAMHKRVNSPSEELVKKYFDQLAGGLLEKKSELKDERIQFKDGDVILEGRSVKEVAYNKAITESRIVEMFKLLVPEEKGFDMDSITYSMIEELFPFSIQLEMMELIAKAISPEYADNRKKS